MRTCLSKEVVASLDKNNTIGYFSGKAVVSLDKKTQHN
jgi:hypothetical protein